VQAAIDALVREKTVIVIAHRLSTIVAADRILVLDHGRLVQQGRHGELLAQGGRYAAMGAAQQRVKGGMRRTGHEACEAKFAFRGTTTNGTRRSQRLLADHQGSNCHNCN
jgi:ATP-binding cassette, subfamily B, bacterial IrtB/YbtQ